MMDEDIERVELDYLRQNALKTMSPKVCPRYVAIALTERGGRGGGDGGRGGEGGGMGGQLYRVRVVCSQLTLSSSLTSSLLLAYGDNVSFDRHTPPPPRLLADWRVDIVP